MNVVFLCDRLACPNCSYPTCRHTFDPSHAVNFEKTRNDIGGPNNVEIIEYFVEKEEETKEDGSESVL